MLKSLVRALERLMPPIKRPDVQVEEGKEPGEFVVIVKIHPYRAPRLGDPREEAAENTNSKRDKDLET